LKAKDVNLFPYFGNKRAVASLVWEYLGNPRNYVEPFAGSLACLMARPDDLTPQHREIVNDADGLLVNFWRAVKYNPAEVARYASNPPFESDLHARHAWLVGRRESLTASLEGDPDWHDVRAAGWWAWGICYWIGSGWCSGKGPWSVVDGKLVKSEKKDGQRRKLIRPDRQGLARAGDDQGQHRKIIQPEERGLPNIARQLIRPDRQGLMNASAAEVGSMETILQVFARRLERVFIMSGDWARVMGGSVTGEKRNDDPIGVFLDPPYADTADREGSLYAVDCLNVAHDVRRWAIENGENPQFRIILAGYEGEHDMPDNWTLLMGRAGGSGIGYGNQKKSEEGYENAGRERLWCSPHCARVTLF